MKVKSIRKAIKDLDDDAEVLLSVNTGRTDDFETITKTYRSMGETRHLQLYVWGDRYQTREVNNAYQANDDRYGGAVLLIEVGTLSY